MRSFLVCIHDATPAYARETRAMIRDLAPLVGRRLAMGVVPNWHGAWPLAAHPDYCRLLRASAGQLLLHGYFHRRRRGWGAATLLTAGADELNGLNATETQHMLERGQRIFSAVFGEAARGFLAPAWQRAHVRPGCTGVEHLLGFFSLDAGAGRKVPLATWTWDCGRWGWLGRAGHGLGRLLQALGRGVPALAIHPGDLARGFWPAILRLIRALLALGYEPTTPSDLLEASHVDRYP